MKTKRTSRGQQILTATKLAAFRNISDGVQEGFQLQQRLVPVDKGDLKSTGKVEDDGQGHASMETGGPSQISGRHVSHHVYIEYGTSKMPAQPNFRPGVDAAKQKIRAGMKIVG